VRPPHSLRSKRKARLPPTTHFPHRFQLPTNCSARAELAAGASDHAVGFATLKDLDRVSAALDALEEESKSGARPVVTVVGAGYAGVELAASVNERLKGKAIVQLIASSDRIMPVRRCFLRTSNLLARLFQCESVCDAVVVVAGARHAGVELAWRA
jgi:hypothetical protein